jgi:hypothetical protein
MLRRRNPRPDPDRETIAQLCAQAERMLAALGLSGPFSPAVLHERVQRHRGRPVQLIARELAPPAPHGLLIVTGQADYVFYDDTADPVRRHQIIGHEFGHLLFDDQPGTGLWRRSSYEVAAERRAEVFGTVALQHLAQWSAPLANQVEQSTLERITTVLTGRPE